MRIFSVQYNPHDDHVFVSGGWDDTIQVSLYAGCLENNLILSIEKDNLCSLDKKKSLLLKINFLHPFLRANFRKIRSQVKVP